MPELECKQLVELITDYLEGALPPAEAERFADHAGRCPGCEAYLEQMRTTIELAGALTEETLEEPMRGRLLAAFRDWRTTRA